MTDHKVAQPGSAEPAATAPRAATTEGQQAQEAPRRMTARRPSGASGVAAAFGSGSGAAWVFRDLASI
jgi:hypothetical protein